MTGCMYISPSSLIDGQYRDIPTILADSIVTRVGASGDLIIPATVHRGNATNYSKIILKRKSYIIAGRAAVAFAGAGDVIEECLEECSAQMPVWLKTDRPMQRLTDFINEYKNIQILGASIDPSNHRINNIWPLDDVRELKQLGKCAAIGSGAAELWSIAQSFERDLARRPPISAAARAFNFPMKVNSYCLGAEVEGRVSDWGGYVESMLIDPPSLTWRRGPRTVHYFYYFEALTGDKATARLLPRVIAYDPGANDGRVLSISIDANKEHMIGDFVLSNLLSPTPKEELTETNAYWNDWAPEIASIVVIKSNGASGNSMSSRSVDAKLDKVTFSYNDGAFGFGLSDELADDICGAAIRGWGKSYVPMRDVA